MVLTTFCKQTAFFQTTYCITMHNATIIETPNKKHILNIFENSRSTLTAMVLLLQHQTNQIFLAVFQVAGTKRMQVVETFRKHMPQHATIYAQLMRWNPEHEVIWSNLMISARWQLKWSSWNFLWAEATHLNKEWTENTSKLGSNHGNKKWSKHRSTGIIVLGQDLWRKGCLGMRLVASPSQIVDSWISPATTLDSDGLPIPTNAYIDIQIQKSNKVTPKSYLKPFPACERNL